MTSINKGKIKLTIAKLIELSIDTDRKTTIAILKKKGVAKITVDQNGKVTLTGSGKLLTFSGDPALEKMGIKVKRMTINLSNLDGMNVGYTASISGPYGVSLSLSGSFNLERLIMACTGLLCSAARALKNRDKQLQEAMGY